MDKLNIALENCYGIGKLNFEFDLSLKGNNKGVYSIYAPNGFMKSSFARTFDDIANKQESKDVIFPERVTNRDILSDGNQIDGDNIFVIKPYQESYSSEQVSLLLVNNTLKQQYDDALKEIQNKKAEIIKNLKVSSSLSGRKESIESVLCSCFGKSENKFYDLISELNQQKDDYSQFYNIIYNELFNEKALQLISSGNLSKELNDYIQTYEKLVDQSPILSKSFNHQNANSISKSLKDTGFFGANHTVNLTLNGHKQEVFTQEDLQQLIDDEQTKVLSDSDLVKKFTAIDKKLSNVDTKKLRDYLTEHKWLLPELADYKTLQRKLWLAYLQEHKDISTELIDIYNKNKKLILDITQKAKEEQTTWEGVVKVFNHRFNVPFSLSIKNQEDVILNSASPTISFDFDDGREIKNVGKVILMDVLSQGERRALYILNLLFEIEVRKRQGEDILFIIDDIADSFDYKNKYSIIEYLKELSEKPNFKIIFLTHNFDFHRTICSRIGIYGAKRLFALKTNTEILLEEERYQRDVLSFWRSQLSIDIKCVLACIPFARNLAEYSGGIKDNAYKSLTSLLHIKPETNDLTILNLQSIYRGIFTDNDRVMLPEGDASIKNKLFEVSHEIVLANSDRAELEDKIILSIAIRLQAEEFMINKINDQAFVDSISKNQTNVLFTRFVSDFSTDKLSINILDQVNLMTPENIHLNSFMYEPILDMSAQHLYQLYTKIENLNNE